MQEIIFVSHCLLNTAAKVEMFDDEAMAAEERLRRRFLAAALERGIQLVQLPCPEFTLYGAARWGHTSDQFDNPFFRAHCRTILEPVLLQLQEYLAHGEKFRVLGVVGVDGSPSCGVRYTCRGRWGGNLGGRGDLDSVIASAEQAEGMGVLMQELADRLRSLGCDVPMEGLYAPEAERVMAMLAQSMS